MSDYQCEKCHDTGYVLEVRDGYDVAVECVCYEKLMARRRLERSRISDELLKKGFKDFDDRGMDVLKNAREKALDYYRNFLANEKERHNSILFCGQVGSGKTHLGMAVCNNLMNICGVGVIYMTYRDAMREIKQTVTDRVNYYAALDPYCNARLLYIDDLLKGRPTEAEMNILYELVNYRYMHNKPMVISTERFPEELVNFDEAIGSRILEMCRGYSIVLKGQELNYRLYSERKEQGK